VRQLIGDGDVTAVHDVADGGLLVALAEMAMASGLGVKLDVTLTTAQAFGEDQSRYIVTTKPDTVLEGAVKLGTVGGSDVAGVAVSALKQANEAFFKDWMEGKGYKQGCYTPAPRIVSRRQASGTRSSRNEKRPRHMLPAALSYYEPTLKLSPHVDTNGVQGRWPLLFPLFS
jgi:hypothetical protein